MVGVNNLTATIRTSLQIQPGIP